MKKKDFLNYLSALFNSNGYFKKGNDWLIESDDLIKDINVQKSNFGDIYYINYGFIIKNLELGKLKMHILFGIGSTNEKENQRIKQLLNLEEDINEKQRFEELEYFIDKSIFKFFNKINTERDLSKYLEIQSDVNNIPFNVRKYFNLL